MKHWLLTIFALSLCMALLLAAPAKDEQAEAEAILDNAIKAVGGPEKFNRITTFVLNLNRTWTPRPGATASETVVISYDYPERKRYELTYSDEGRKTTTVQILNGDKAWASSRGTTQELTSDQAARMKADLFADFAVRQLPLYKGKEYKLTLLGKSKVEGENVVGLKVSSEGKPDALLFFDKDTGLLHKHEYEFPTDTKSKPIAVQIIYEEYKEAAGIKYPAKTTRIQGGQKVREDEVTEFRVVEKFEEKTFAKPE